jgi:hypothetical protein
MQELLKFKAHEALIKKLISPTLKNAPAYYNATVVIVCKVVSREIGSSCEMH